MMLRIVAVFTAVATLACANDTVRTVEPSSVRVQQSLNVTESSAPLVLHVVPPQATDPAIDQFLDNHYVWLDTSAHSIHRLLVLMTGTGQVPAQFLFVEREAARLGYHVIGLEYVNSGGIAKLCPPTPDPASCFENVRLEVIDGIDRSPLVSVNPTNSIDNRLEKLLRLLAAQHSGEGWSQFLDGNGIKWPLIAVAGLSVGGGEAAMLAKIRLVDRVVMFSAVPDSIGKGSVPWVGTHRTPIDRYFGLAHNRDGFFLPILAGWDSLGLAAFGPTVLVDGSEPPYDFSHMLVTGRTPVGGFVGLNAHGSTATDSFTPLAADGTPYLLDAWRYMLSALPRHPGTPLNHAVRARR
jgi:hypothetical protein